jgi:hypothetical protein
MIYAFVVYAGSSDSDPASVSKHIFTVSAPRFGKKTTRPRSLDALISSRRSAPPKSLSRAAAIRSKTIFGRSPPHIAV